MDRAQVAAFYRGKGYQVHESIVVTGQSGNQQRVPLLCEGPLGNLAVFFGDAAGVDGPEIGAAKRVAKDLGATAVVAAGQFTNEQRGHAAELGVVLLDADAIGTQPPTPRIESAWPGHAPAKSLELDLAAHPWPRSGRPETADAGPSLALSDIDQVQGRGDARTRTQADPGMARVPDAPAARSDAGGLWKHGRAPRSTLAAPPPVPPAPAGRFAWLDLPKATVEAELEVDADLVAQAKPVPLTPEQEAAQLQADLLREATRALWIKRGAWTLGVALFVWLFLLWWF